MVSRRNAEKYVVHLAFKACPINGHYKVCKPESIIDCVKSCQCNSGGNCVLPSMCGRPISIPTISQRRTSGGITSARRNVSASLIPARLCVLVLTASTGKCTDFWMESRAATGTVPECAHLKELLIIQPLMVTTMTSLVTAHTHLSLYLLGQL